MALTISELQVIVWLIVLVQGVLLVAVVRRQNDIESLLRSVDLPADGVALTVGHAAPDFEAQLLESGATVDGRRVRAGGGGGLLFLSAKCGACARIARSLGKEPLPEGMFVVWLGDADEWRAATEGTCDALVSGGHRLANLYSIRVLPTLVLIDSAGMVVGVNHPVSAAEANQLVAATRTMPNERSIMNGIPMERRRNESNTAGVPNRRAVENSAGWS